MTVARARLKDVLDRVADGEDVVLTHHGRAVAVIARPDRYASRRVTRTSRDAEALARRLRTGAPDPIDLPPGAAERMVDELYAERADGWR